MEIQQLRYVVLLARERHFSRSAKKGNVTQPTLSQQIKKLEEELGTSLFERSAHGVRLTPSGEKFLPYAKNILDQIDQSISAVQDDTGEIKGTLHVGSIPTMAPYLFPQLIVAIKKQAPQLKLEIYEEKTSVLVEKIKDGVLDLAILSIPLPDTGIVSKSLGFENFFLAVANKHPLADQKNISPKALNHEQLLILQEGHCFSEQALDYCKRSRSDEQVIFQGSSLPSVMTLAEVGEGVTLVPAMALNKKAYPKLRFIPFKKPGPKRELGAIWRISAPLQRAHRLVIEETEKILNARKKL